MKALWRIAALTILLLAAAAAVFQLSAGKAFDANIMASTSADLPLYLNGEQVGTMSNTKTLEARLKSLQDHLTGDNFNAPDGSIPTIGRLVFVADNQLPVAELGRLWKTLDDFFDFPLNRMTLWKGHGCDQSHPHAATGAVSIVSNAPLSAAELAEIKSNEQCWLSTEVMMAGPDNPAYSTRLLKSYRTAVSSIEILPGGSYVINEQIKNERLRASPMANLTNPALRRKVDAAVVTRRSIEPAAIQTEVDAWAQHRISEEPNDESMPEEDAVDLPVIVKPAVSYDALTRLFPGPSARKFRFVIVVDNTVAASPAKAKLIRRNYT